MLLHRVFPKIWTVRQREGQCVSNYIRRQVLLPDREFVVTNFFLYYWATFFYRDFFSMERNPVYFSCVKHCLTYWYSYRLIGGSKESHDIRKIRLNYDDGRSRREGEFSNQNFRHMKIYVWSFELPADRSTTGIIHVQLLIFHEKYGPCFTSFTFNLNK